MMKTRVPARARRAIVHENWRLKNRAQRRARGVAFRAMREAKSAQTARSLVACCLFGLFVYSIIVAIVCLFGCLSYPYYMS